MRYIQIAVLMICIIMVGCGSMVKPQLKQIVEQAVEQQQQQQNTIEPKKETLPPSQIKSYQEELYKAYDLYINICLDLVSRQICQIQCKGLRNIYVWRHTQTNIDKNTGLKLINLFDRTYPNFDKLMNTLCTPK